MKAFFCELLFSCLLASPGAKPIDELTYGTVLFSYYTEDYQQALLDTMVAEGQNRRGDDVVRFDLAKGSFAFSDGMYAFSREIFDAVGEQELTELDRLRLAFHLGREYHRRADYDRLAEQLAKIDLGKGLFGRQQHHPEVEFMRAEVELQAGNFAAARSATDNVRNDHPLWSYGIYNLGVALRGADDLAGARDAFTELASQKTADDEVYDLQQRARLALAFIAREQQDYTNAEAVLAALPGSGRYRDIALAAYGGLAMDSGDYELAARIWLTLQNQDYWSKSTAQARLGFPVSLERLASQEMALLKYREAARGFEARLAKLDELSTQAEDPEWVRGLLLAFSAPDQDPEQLGDLMDRWRAQLDHTDWLEWLASENVHELLMQWRELLDMQDWLDRLPKRLDAYAEVAAEQHRRSASARELLYHQQLLDQRAALRGQIAVLDERLAALRVARPVPDAAWMNLLADAEQQQLLAELEAMQALAQTHLGVDQAKWLARIERLRGVVFWQLVDASSVRIRELEKQLAVNQALLADVDERVARVQNAEQQFAGTVAVDFERFSQRAEVIAAQVDSALVSRESMLAQEIRRGMQREKREVKEYLLVARIAIARATDQLALGAVGGGH